MWSYEEERENALYNESLSQAGITVEAESEFVREVGRENTEQAWILSDRDVWYPNPFYFGPDVPHPEEY